MIRVQALSVCLVAFFMAAAFVVEAQAIGICKGGNRAARGVTCIVDADTWWHRGEKYRHAYINAPEISSRHAQCRQEIRLGLEARRRLQQLMGRGFRTVMIGKTGRYGRELAIIRLNDGREAGEVLVSEGYAKPYGTPGSKEWCR